MRSLRMQLPLYMRGLSVSVLLVVVRRPSFKQRHHVSGLPQLGQKVEPAWTGLPQFGQYRGMTPGTSVVAVADDGPYAMYVYDNITAIQTPRGIVRSPLTSRPATGDANDSAT